jgi:hypothetical protein
MARDTDPQTAEPRRIFATAPSDIVVFEMLRYDEPKIEKDPKSGIRREVGRLTGETLSVRSEVAHIEGKIAHPIDGSDPLPYGPGLAGHWAKHARSGK